MPWFKLRSKQPPAQPPIADSDNSVPELRDLRDEVTKLREELKDKPATRVERLIDKPVARITAVVALVAALFGVSAVWPKEWWPYSVPPLDVVLEPKADWSTVYALDKSADAIQGAPDPHSGDGCFSAARHDWAHRLGGVPVSEVRETFDLTARREGSVLVTGFDVTVDHRSSGYSTGVVPCVEYFNTGGADYYERNIFVDFSNAGPTVTFRDEGGNEVDRLGVNLEKGDAASFVVFPGVIEDTGEAYEWHGTLRVIEKGKQESYRVPETGSFHIASLTENRTYWSDEKPPMVCRPEATDSQWCN